MAIDQLLWQMLLQEALAEAEKLEGFVYDPDSANDPKSLIGQCDCEPGEDWVPDLCEGGGYQVSVPCVMRKACPDMNRLFYHLRKHEQYING